MAKDVIRNSNVLGLPDAVVPHAVPLLIVRRLALSAGAVLACAVTILAAAASQQSPQSSPEPQATFKATTRIVNVNVVITDSHGNPITGLTKDDFELFDNGKPQSIRLFEAIENAAPAPAAPLPPDTYTNQESVQSTLRSVTALLVDLQHSDWPAQHYLIYHLRGFLRKLHPEDHIAIYLLTDDKVLMLHDFTQDSSDLIAAIQRYDAQHAGPRDQRIKVSTGNVSELDRLLSGGDTQFRFDQWRSSIAPPPAPRAQTITTLTDIARHLASAAGRKSLVWLYGATFNKGVAVGATRLLPDEGELQHELAGRLMGSYSWPPHRYQGAKAFLLGPNGPDPEYRALRDIRAGLYSEDLVPLLVRIFNDSGIAVYPVDASGLQTKGFGGFDDLGFRNPNTLPPLPTTIHPDPRNPPFDLAAMADDAVHGNMSSMAARTGGRAWYNRNDLETGIQNALDDGRYSYELAYYPDHNDWRGEWRKIKVKLKDPHAYVQRPEGFAQELENLLIGGYNVHVLARGGYYAFPESKPAQQQDRKELLTDTAQSASDVGDLPFTARVVPLPGSDDSEVLLFLNLDANKLLTQEAENRWRGNFELLFFQLGQQQSPTMRSRPTRALRRSTEPALHKRSEVPGVIDVPVKKFVLDLNEAEYQKAVKTGMSTMRRLKLVPGATALVVVLHDKNSDAVGSVHIPLARYVAALQ